MCHIINKPKPLPPRWRWTSTTRSTATVRLFGSAAASRVFVWLSLERCWGKPWMNYCTFLLFNSIISDFKDCQHRESTSLYNVHNYRALVQHWNVEQRLDSFVCLLLFVWFLVTAFLLSLGTDPLLFLIYLSHRWCRRMVFLGQGFAWKQVVFPWK